MYKKGKVNPTRSIKAVREFIVLSSAWALSTSFMALMVRRRGRQTSAEIKFYALCRSHYQAGEKFFSVEELKSSTDEVGLVDARADRDGSFWWWRSSKTGWKGHFMAFCYLTLCPWNCFGLVHGDDISDWNFLMTQTLVRDLTRPTVIKSLTTFGFWSKDSECAGMAQVGLFQVLTHEKLNCFDDYDKYRLPWGSIKCSSRFIVVKNRFIDANLSANLQRKLEVFSRRLKM